MIRTLLVGALLRRTVYEVSSPSVTANVLALKTISPPSSSWIVSATGAGCRVLFPAATPDTVTRLYGEAAVLLVGVSVNVIACRMIRTVAVPWVVPQVGLFSQVDRICQEASPACAVQARN